MLAIPLVNGYSKLPTLTEQKEERITMAQVCRVCGKKPISGHNVSHANNRTKRRWNVNLRRVKVRLESGEVRRIRVCTGCIKSGRIQKAA